MHYNPFAYIRSEKDILKLVNTRLLSTPKARDEKSARRFLGESGEALLYRALIGYIWYEAPARGKELYHAA